jgi:glutamine amidotransferase
MKVAMIRYNSGNTASVANALKRLGVDAIISDDPETLRSASHVIFPGVGEASSAMNYLIERGLDATISSLTQPVLGICLGMQLLCASSEENATECLGVVPNRVRRFELDGLKVPHTGWNTVSEFRSPLFDGIKDEEHFYFVHGYFVEPNDKTVAACSYGTKFSAAIAHENFYGVQFHPEKSGALGRRLLENFLSL